MNTQTSSRCAFIRFAICLLSGCFLVSTLSAATAISGNQSGTFALSNSPYLVTSDVFVPGGQTLTIEAGVVVQFQDPDDGLIVDGTLIARGTTAAPITFTSDDGQKTPGQWEAIIFRSGSTTNCLMENCIVEYAAALGVSNEAVRFESASPTLLNCTIRHSRLNGMSFLFSDARIENCRFINNGGFAMAMRADSLPRLKNNTASGNGHDAIGVYGFDFSRTGTWVKDNLPYTVVDDLYINGGKTLTIEPGVVVQFQDPDDGLIVDGTLMAKGTAASPIRFTSDDAVKAPGQWEAIIFRSGSTTNCLMENCIVEYAAALGVSNEAVRFENASPTLLNCTISNSRFHGMTFLFSDPTIENCQFLNNGLTNKNAFAMAMRTDSLPRLKNNSASGNVHDAIGVYGFDVSRTGTWVKDNLPYTIVEDTYVNGGKTLTIAPGVILQFQNPDTALVVDGTLIARGTAGAPITFTSDDAQKAPGQWEAIIFRSGSTTNCLMENCLVEYAAARGVSDEAIRFESASPTLLNCTISNSRLNGMSFLFSDARIENCRFTNNGGFAMAMRADSLPRLKNNTASGNGHDAIGVYGFDFSRTGTWVKDNLPYTVVEDLYINGGKTLTIEPGVIVQFQDPDDALVVDGTLIAKGTATAPIRFTSDDTQKAPGQWEAIIFRDGSVDADTLLENCIIEYGAAQGVSDESIRFESASPTLRNCTISNSRLHGMTFLASDPLIENCQFLNNGSSTKGFAMAMRTDSLPRLRNNAASGNGHDAIEVFGFNFSRTGSWTRDNLPYTIVEDLYVNGGKTLTIEPGTTIQFQDPDDGLIIDGTLIARGTVNSPIRFTSDEAVKKPGQWEAIIFRDGTDDANTILENCIVEYGGAASEGQVEFFAASPRIVNCTIQNSISDGLHANNSSPPITSSRIVNNGRDGVRTLSGANPTISNSTIAANTEFGVRNFDTSKIINAKSNFWGDATGPLDTANTDGLNLLNANSKGSKVSEFVNWSGFLGSDPVTPTLTAAIGLLPISLDFGSVTIGQSKDMSLTVRNSGMASLTISAATSSNARFAMAAPSIPFNVATGAEQVVTVRFTPSLAQAENGTLSFSSNDPNRPTATVTLVGLGVSSGSTANCLTPPLGLVSWWSGDSTADDLVGTNHGVLTNGATLHLGKVGSAFSFSTPTSRIDAGTTGMNVGPGDFTIDGWAQTSATKTWNTLVSFDTYHPALYLKGNGALQLFPQPESAPSGLNDGQFHHFAVVRQNGVVTYYKDGGAIGTAGFADPLTPQKFYIGDDLYGGDQFAGLIDELDFFSRALSASEIRAIFQAGSEGKCKSRSETVNLLRNPGAEEGQGSSSGREVLPIPAWTTTSNFTVVKYGAPDGFPAVADSQPISGGNNFFAGGPDNGTATATQLVDVSNQAADIDAGRRKANLRAQLAAYGGGDNSSVKAEFLSSSGAVLGSISIGPISGPQNLFQLKAASSAVSGGTRSIRVTMISVWMSGIDNDGYFDNLFLDLSEITPLPSTTNCPALPAGLVAWWKAEGNGNDSQGTNHGTLNGVKFALGQVGQAFNLDGVTNSVSTPLDVQPSALPSTTWEAWVFPTQPGGRQQILSSDDGGYDRSVMVEGNGFGVFTGAGLWSPTNVTFSEWQHIAVVFTPGNIEFYKNGVRFSYGFAPTGQATGYKLQIGRNPGFGEFFKGLIDEVSIFNRALTSDEIRAIYNAGSTGKCPVGVTPGGPTVPDIDVLPASLSFGNVLPGRSSSLIVTIRNTGNVALTVNSITSNNRTFSVIAPATPLTVAAGAQQTVTVVFAPTALGSQSGTLSIASNDPDEGTVTVSLTGAGVEAAPASVLISDSFSRADADRCALGKADLALGGAGNHFYLPLFPTGGTDVSRPIGANIVSGALQNNGLDYGGVQFVAAEGACGNLGLRGENIGQDINIKADLLVPTDAAGNISQAGPYLRSRGAAAGDRINGSADFDPSGGYWVQLHSSGEVKVKRLYPPAMIAFTGRPASFNASGVHSLEIAARGDTLQVALDGRLQTFSQDGKLVTAVSIPNTGTGNQGTAGIAFGAEDNRGKIGGQRADNLIVTAFRSLEGLPMQNNFTAPPLLSIQHDQQANVVISWPATAADYFLQSAESLTAPIQWLTLTNRPLATSGRLTITVSPGKRMQFYRLFSSTGTTSPNPSSGEMPTPLQLPSDWQPSFPVLASASETIAASTGGTIQLSGGAALTIPASALLADTKITVTKLEMSEFSAGVSREVYRIDAGGVQLQKPATLVLPYKRLSGGTKPSGIHVLRSSSEEGTQELPAQVDEASSTVRVVTDHFSIFTVEQEASYLDTFLNVGTAAGRILPVPYYPQGDTMWCFAASSQMMLKHYGVDVEAWNVARYFGLSLDESPKQWRLWVGNYSGMFQSFGVKVKETSGWVLALNANGYLIQQIDAGRPVFVTLQNAVHAVVVVGYDSTGIYIHDPSGYAFEFVTGQTSDEHLRATRKLSWDEWLTAMYGKQIGKTRVIFNAPFPVWTIVLDGPPAPPDPPLTVALISAIPLSETLAVRGFLEINRPLPARAPPKSHFLWDGRKAPGYRFVPDVTFVPGNIANSDEMVLWVHLANPGNTPASGTLRVTLDDRKIYQSPKPEIIAARTSLHQVILFDEKSPYRFKDASGAVPVPGPHLLLVELDSGGKRVDGFPIEFQIGPARPEGLEKNKITEGVKLTWKANPEEKITDLLYDIYRDDQLIGATSRNEYLIASAPIDSKYTIVAHDIKVDLESPPSDAAKKLEPTVFVRQDPPLISSAPPSRTSIVSDLAKNGVIVTATTVELPAMALKTLDRGTIAMDKLRLTWEPPPKEIVAGSTFPFAINASAGNSPRVDFSRYVSTPTGVFLGGPPILLASTYGGSGSVAIAGSESKDCPAFTSPWVGCYSIVERTLVENITPILPEVTVRVEVGGLWALSGFPSGNNTEKVFIVWTYAPKTAP